MLQGLFGSRNLTQSNTDSDYKTNFDWILWGVIFVVILNMSLWGFMWWGFKATLEWILIVQFILFLIYAIIMSMTAYVSRGYFREDAMDWMGLLTNHQVNTTTAASGKLFVIGFLPDFSIASGVLVPL